MYCNFMSHSMGNKANDIKKCFERSSFPHRALKDNHKICCIIAFFVKSFPTDSNLLSYEVGLHNNAHIRFLSRAEISPFNIIFFCKLTNAGQARVNLKSQLLHGDPEDHQGDAITDHSLRVVLPCRSAGFYPLLRSNSDGKTAFTFAKY